MDAAEPGDVTAHRELLLTGLRSFGGNYTEITRRFADFLGLHSTDGAALAEILYAEDKSDPMTPARLSERISLTSGATTTLLNRLERAGHIVRTREHADRRVVTLRSSPQIAGPAREFFAPLGDTLDAMVSQYPPELLGQIEAFLDDLRTTMDDLLAGPTYDRGPGHSPIARPGHPAEPSDST